MENKPNNIYTSYVNPIHYKSIYTHGATTGPLPFAFQAFEGKLAWLTHPITIPSRPSLSAHQECCVEGFLREGVP
jgi:hypothetical protein